MEEKVIDLSDVLDRVQDDKELLLELFDIFEEDFKTKRKEMDHYLTDKNAEMLRNIAHSLKGASGNISAKRIYAICLFIEKEAASVRLDGIAGKLKELDKEFRQYQKEAEKIKQEYHPF
jgi:HPt (histidine-containing phosphotransfer) domain-containing protein